MAQFDYRTRLQILSWWSVRLWAPCLGQCGWQYLDQLVAVWVAVMGVTPRVGLHMGRPSSAHSVTPLTTLLSPLCSLYLTLSPRRRVTDAGRVEAARETGRGRRILLDTGIAEFLAKYNQR